MVDDVIRITDLANPELTELQKAALAFGDSLELDLSVDAVLNAAKEETGLDDFGPADFRERLELWLTEVDENPDTLNLLRYVIFTNCVRYASSRLRIRDLLERHPEIHEQEIEEVLPIINKIAIWS